MEICSNRSILLTFDDLLPGAAIPNGYNVSRYCTGTVSENLTTFNGGETPMTMTGANGALFTLNSDGVITNNTFILRVFTLSYIIFNGYSRLDTAVFSTSGEIINPTVFWRSWSICNG
ncbi:unnamed protein product [Adineta steineri]|uniref:Uncharacterized protein n=1 Tax=Adineta steineri TaxID=433720 RepID=A0A819V2B6_9BILA|nr:unnamed protein product [Adineta steineri]CAF4103568.1 unnamed protein product [Adineta steineri]